MSPIPFIRDISWRKTSTSTFSLDEWQRKDGKSDAEQRKPAGEKKTAAAAALFCWFLLLCRVLLLLLYANTNEAASSPWTKKNTFSKCSVTQRRRQTDIYFHYVWCPMLQLPKWWRCFSFRPKSRCPALTWNHSSPVWSHCFIHHQRWAAGLEYNLSFVVFEEMYHSLSHSLSYTHTSICNRLTSLSKDSIAQKTRKKKHTLKLKQPEMQT